MSAVVYGFLRGVMRTLTLTILAGGLFQVRGRELVPRSGALLVCANHTATVDPPLVPAFLPRADSWSMAKSEYFTGSILWRWLMHGYHAFPVVRHSPDRLALERAASILDAGEVVILYPEGTRVEQGGLRRGEPGAGFIARRSGAAVLPVGLVGSRDCLPKGSRLPRRRPVELIFGPPFLIPERRPDGRRVSNQEAADAIMVAIAHLLPESMRGDYTELETWSQDLLGVTQPGV
ncbi:MAG TPA: lysophospholipid acyltransferase family protein [Candidatus Nitrosotalea sp.]|nr:lysophospholipid acyltransferase family protein [Candidatus Nitrosotalea sp.]